MERFIPREKLSKQQRAALDKQKRQAWPTGMTVQRVESKKQYSRKRPQHWKREFPDAGVFYCAGQQSLSDCHIS